MPDKSAPGYISIVLIVLLGIFALLAYPYNLNLKRESDCILGDKPKPFTTTMPIIADRFDSPGLGGGYDSANFDEYVLVRENVPLLRREYDPSSPDPYQTFDFSLETGAKNEHTVFFKNIDRDGKRYDVYYPGVAGEIDFHREFKAGYDNTKPDSPLKNQFRFRQEGFIFFVHTNDDGSPKLEDDIYTVDFYQEKKTFENAAKDYKIEEVFRCEKGVSKVTGVTVPEQAISSDNQQLQLEWFLLKLGYMNAHCKPAIYLYPKEKTLINVKIKTKGFLTLTIPQYDADKGWSVWANPDGVLTTNYQLQTTNYPYLYYESKVPDELIQKPEKGWVVNSSEFRVQSSEWFNPLKELFNDILPKLGLNAIQTSDFIEYWSKALPYSPYYFVGVMDQENVNSFEPLEITPKPDFVNRVRIYFERLDSPKQVEAPEPTTNDQRLTTNSFHVVEWGGMVKNDPNHPFTCSQ